MGGREMGEQIRVFRPVQRLRGCRLALFISPLLPGPQVELPELLLEVNSWTTFTAEFTHLGEDNAWIESLPTSICAVLMAEACNIGLKQLARKDVPALRWDRLRWVQQHYVRADTITSANARLVDKQASIQALAARRWVQLRRILAVYRPFQDTGVPAYRCFRSQYYRDPTV